MSIFPPFVICVVYVCILSLFTSISWARHLGSIGVGVINTEDPQHPTFQNPSKSPGKMEVLDMSTVPLGTHTSAMITQQGGRTKLKPKQGRISDANPKSKLNDHHNNHEDQDLITNGMRIIRARNGHGNEAKLSPLPNLRGKSSRHLAMGKREPPQAMVSWRVPTKKKKKGEHQEEEEQPDFDLDYAPPKVHPPTHN